MTNADTIEKVENNAKSEQRKNIDAYEKNRSRVGGETLRQSRPNAQRPT